MNKSFLILFAIIYLIVIISTVMSDPPQTINVRGTIYHNDSSYATGGFPVTINNTISEDFVRTRTIGQATPRIDASYVTTISGNVGDTTIIMSWNLTHYGINITTLVSPTTRTNVILNTTRPSELNVTITYPNNNSKFNISDYFNLTVAIENIGGTNGLNCNAYLLISNQEVIKLAPTESITHNLGTIIVGNTLSTNWNLTGNYTSNSNITVTANCTTDGINFEKLTSYSIYNITIQDIINPAVSLISPVNNSRTTESTSPIIFSYNVSDGSKIANCSLFIDNILNQTNDTIIKNIPQQFKVYISNDTYNWSVQCTDNSSYLNVGFSEIFNLSIIPNFPPTVSNMNINNLIDLNPGTTTKIYCNASIHDDNNISDIISINSTFFLNSSGAGAENDNNYHYMNNSCEATSFNTYDINYSCSFNVEYYANNGTWLCNLTAMDNSSTYGSDTINTEINQLLAIDVSPSVIDYGKLEVGENSSTDFVVNITNLGNVDFNITLEGFARQEGDNLSMNCTKGNISVGLERYSVYQSKDFGYMINLSSIATKVQNISLPHRTNDTTIKSDRNYTYWKIGLPMGIQGQCSGFVEVTSVLY